MIASVNTQCVLGFVTFSVMSCCHGAAAWYLYACDFYCFFYLHGDEVIRLVHHIKITKLNNYFYSELMLENYTHNPLENISLFYTVPHGIAYPRLSLASRIRQRSGPSEMNGDSGPLCSTATTLPGYAETRPPTSTPYRPRARSDGDPSVAP